MLTFVIGQPRGHAATQTGEDVWLWRQGRLPVALLHILSLTFQDRRPITPPPCIRVVITDVATGVEIDTK